MVENKEVMARNIRYYMEVNHVNSTEICNALNFKQSTFSNWINAKIYPRIDKIEKMANYFGISKSDLVEEKTHHPVDLMDEEYNILLEYNISHEQYKTIIGYIKRIAALSKERQKTIFDAIELQEYQQEKETREKETNSNA